MGVKGKQKGSAFERTVARLILKAAGDSFSKEDCYRTPMSGGHPYAGESDLVLSEKLRLLFPFVVECKHRKGWDAYKMFKPSGLFMSFIKQVTVASKKDKLHRWPLLVIRGNNTKIYAASTVEAFEYWSRKVTNAPGFVFTSPEKVPWKLVMVTVVLSALSIKAKRGVR